MIFERHVGVAVRFMLVALAGLTLTATAARGQTHGVGLAYACQGPTPVGNPIDCTSTLSYNDDFGDTLIVTESFDVVDPGGAAIRVPAVGNLPVLQIAGNARFAGAPGELPVIVGAAFSTLNGLPGLPQNGFVQFINDQYVLQPGDPDPLFVQAQIVVTDNCDEPATQGCFSFPNTIQFTAAISHEKGGGGTHGAQMSNLCMGPVPVGETVDCDITVNYNDQFGDTVRILEAFDVIDPGGQAVRIPPVGNLEIVAAFGNTTAVAGGALPVSIGPGGSVLGGLPGDRSPGVVIFRDDLYVVQSGDGPLLLSQASVIVEDQCDDPDTQGCFSFPNQLQSSSSTEVIECSAGSHGLGIFKVCDGPAMPGETISCETGLFYNDDFCDTLEITEAFDIVDPPGAAIRVPATGNFPVFELTGNAVFTGVPGELPVILGVPGSTLNGLPGDPAPGGASFINDQYVIQPGDPDPIFVQATVIAIDSCDSPTTQGCFSFPNQVQFTAAVDIELSNDCNDNGVDDATDIAMGTSDDCDGNGIPDECDLDTNRDGLIDACDCNDNGVLDEEDITFGTSLDYNLDGVPDECTPNPPGSAVWTSFDGGSFSDDGNWEPQTPGPDNVAVFDLDTMYTVTLGTNITNDRLVVRSGSVQCSLGAFEYRVLSSVAPGLLVGSAAGDIGMLSLLGGTVEATSCRVGSDAGAFGTLVLGRDDLDTPALLNLAENLCVGCAGTGTLSITDGAAIVCRDAAIGQLTGSQGNVTLSGNGSMLTAPFFIIVDNGTLNVGAGATVVAGFDVFGGVFLFEGGVLTGDGTIDGTVVNFGELLPGGPAGPTIIEGDYLQVGEVPGLPPSSGVMRMELPATESGPAGALLEVSGDIQLGGGLIVTLAPGADPLEGENFPLVTGTNVLDRFDVAFTPGLSGGRFLRVDYDTAGGVTGTNEQIGITIAQLATVLGFDDPGSIQLQGAPSAVAVADFDGDGLDDLAVAVPDTDSIYVFSDATTGPMGELLGFEVTTISVATPPVGITAGNLQAGGSLPDLAITSGVDSSVRILKNNGNGTFTPAPGSLPTGVDPRGLAAADFSGDGLDDLMVANRGSDTLSLFINISDTDPTAGFAPPLTLLAGQSGPTRVDPDDLDGDRCIDAVVTSAASDSVSVFLNQGPGGGTVFGPPGHITVGDEPLDTAVSDLNADGLPDIATSNNGDGTVSVVINEGGGSFAPAVNLPVGALARSLTIVDLESDGDRDVAVVTTGQSGLVVRVLRNDLNQGQLVFAEAEELDFGENPLLVTSGDVDGDGQDDLVSVNAGAGVGVVAAGSPGSLNVLFNAGSCPGDINGDGEVDVDDLNAVILDWGTDGSSNGGDITGPMPGDPPDGIVNVNDLIEVIGGWGDC